MENKRYAGLFTLGMGVLVVGGGFLSLAEEPGSNGGWVLVAIGAAIMVGGGLIASLPGRSRDAGNRSSTTPTPTDPRIRKMRIAGGVALLLGLVIGAGGNPDATNFARLLLLIGAGLLVAAWIIKPEPADRPGQQAS